MQPSPVVNPYPNKDNGFFKLFGSKEVPDLWQLAEYFYNELNVRFLNTIPWRYKDGFYEQTSNAIIKTEISVLTLRKVTPNQLRQFLEIVQTRCEISGESAPEYGPMLNLANGVLDLKTKTLLPHSSEYFFKYKLPHAYDPNAKCTEWQCFMDYVFEGNQDLADLSAEIFGYTLAGGNPWLHKAFMLLGEGRNGKSVYLDVLKHLLGRANISAIPIDQLNKPFSVVQADGKLANIIGETTSKEIDSESFKIASSGEELTAANKFQAEYSMPFRARIIFATNRLPMFKDPTTGSFERLCIVPFNRYIKEKDRDPGIAEKLKLEASGILNWALGGLDRLNERQRLPEIEIVKANIIEYRKDTDSIFDWVQQHIDFDAAQEKTFMPRDLYGHYRKFCEETSRKPVSLIGFSRRVSREVQRKTDVTISSTRTGIRITARVKLPNTLSYSYSLI